MSLSSFHVSSFAGTSITSEEQEKQGILNLQNMHKGQKLHLTLNNGSQTHVPPPATQKEKIQDSHQQLQRPLTTRRKKRKEQKDDTAAAPVITKNNKINNAADSHQKKIKKPIEHYSSEFSPPSPRDCQIPPVSSTSIRLSKQKLKPLPTPPPQFLRNDLSKKSPAQSRAINPIHPHVAPLSFVPPPPPRKLPSQRVASSSLEEDGGSPNFDSATRVNSNTNGSTSTNQTATKLSIKQQLHPPPPRRQSGQSERSNSNNLVSSPIQSKITKPSNNINSNHNASARSTSTTTTPPRRKPSFGNASVSGTVATGTVVSDSVYTNTSRSSSHSSIFLDISLGSASAHRSNYSALISSGVGGAKGRKSRSRSGDGRRVKSGGKQRRRGKSRPSSHQEKKSSATFNRSASLGNSAGGACQNTNA